MADSGEEAELGLTVFHRDVEKQLSGHGQRIDRLEDLDGQALIFVNSRLVQFEGKLTQVEKEDLAARLLCL